MSDQSIEQPARLSLSDRLDLASDPRMKNPEIRARIFAKLGPDDRDWLTQALAPEQPMNAMGAAKDLMRKGGTYAADHPGEVGTALGAAASMPFTGGLSALPALATAGTFGFTGNALGNLIGAGTTAPNTPQTIPESLKTSALAGGSAAAGEGMGRVLQGFGNLLMNENVPSAIAADFPTVNIGRVLNREGINPLSAKGAANAEALRNASADRTQGLVETAARQGTPGIQRRDLVPYLQPATKQASKEAAAGVPGGAQTIEDRINALLDAQFPYADIPVNQAPGITQVLQNEGKTARKMLGQGKHPTDLGAITADNLAAGVRTETANRVPGYTDSNKLTQELIAAAQAANKMKNQPIRLGGWPSRLTAAGAAATGIASGNPLAGGLAASIPLALGTPQISVPTAIALYQAGKIPYELLTSIVGPELLRAQGIGPLPSDHP